ncbi:hypothetical protein XENTR_v10004185 [Xenopus tropicalis]|uniref:WAP four-disulfide core domain protein 5 n=1 Tax=Xenopus tropicalis TaxID=8364 RepID=A0A8J1IYL1_XENTR|nr:WAP four-disulfide core domain protein 5 [Xenopus tropicalis]KAE8576436.1 hypothetical protein XENTR_v10004185 [Xenopus tropicalis]KAE8576437.1 hypothetical protein XENTR_v10004185 [Xenopus tropicalis]|eukprot:XP_002933214.1 PREDICTED: WAP four-disulfide core domain protein 5-like [Xenopus tropicalis]
MMNTGQICVIGLLLCAVGLCTSAAKPGRCPPEAFLAEKYLSHTNRCRSDGDCGGNKKCCMDNGENFCKPPAHERPGACPFGTRVPRKTDYCTSDSMCPVGSKCCFREGGRTCLPSVGVKKGSCPPGIMINCFVPMRSGCQSDSTCPGNEKCCRSGCYSECKPPNF